MRRIQDWKGWGQALAMLALSPIVLIVALPVAIGVGLNIFGRDGDTLVTLALCGPLALLVLGRALPRMPLRRAVTVLATTRPHPGRLRSH